MQFKLLAATLLASSVAAEYANYMDCLVKKECRGNGPCIHECLQIDKAKPDQIKNFNKCVPNKCIEEDDAESGIKDWDKFYKCLPKCYNEHIGKPNDTQVDLNAKASDKKGKEKKEYGNKEGDKEGENKEREKNEDGKEEKKEGDKKDDTTSTTGNATTSTNTTTTKPPTPAPTNNAFKTIPSVFVGLFIAALVL